MHRSGDLQLSRVDERLDDRTALGQARSRQASVRLGDLLNAVADRPPRHLQPGARLGPYEILSPLGAGGMGTVYKARDTQLERLVALKLLHKNLGSEADHDAQLQQEARIAASVNHPNVVQIFSLGMDHGQFYVVMELIDHGSLDDLIESQSRLPEHQVLDVGIQIARGLRAAHRKGLIHRDVKPANILFVDEQAEGPYKLWRHQHTFEAAGRGTRVKDKVEYVLPFGPFGRLAHSVLVRKQLLGIFNYRQEQLGKILGGGTRQTMAPAVH